MPRKSIKKGSSVRFTGRFRDGTYGIKASSILPEVSVSSNDLDLDKWTYKSDNKCSDIMFTKEWYYGKQIYPMVNRFLRETYNTRVADVLERGNVDTTAYIQSMREYRAKMEMEGREYLDTTPESLWLEHFERNFCSGLNQEAANPFSDALLLISLCIYKSWNKVVSDGDRDVHSHLYGRDMFGVGELMNRASDYGLYFSYRCWSDVAEYIRIMFPTAGESMNIDSSIFDICFDFLGMEDEAYKLISYIRDFQPDVSDVAELVNSKLNEENNEVFRELSVASKSGYWSTRRKYINIGERYFDMQDRLMCVLDIKESGGKRFYKLLHSIDNQMFWVRDNMVKHL